MSKLWRAVTRKRNILLVVVGLLAATTAVGLFDAFARYTVKALVAAEYFPGIREHTFDSVKEELPFFCDEAEGIRAAREFLNRERSRMKLTTKEPQWGWQVQNYLFTIWWRNTWVAKFRISEEYRPINEGVNPKFKEEISDAVCEGACPGSLILC